MGEITTIRKYDTFKETKYIQKLANGEARFLKCVLTKHREVKEHMTCW